MTAGSTRLPGSSASSSDAPHDERAAAVMSAQLWWYTARAGGIVAWLLLAASVLWGLAISSKATLGRLRPNWMLDVHRFLGGLATIFVGVHVTGLVLDDYAHFGPSEVLVPLASAWRPVAVAWGVVALDLLAAVGTDLPRPATPPQPGVASRARPGLPDVRARHGARADRGVRRRQRCAPMGDVGDRRRGD